MSADLAAPARRVDPKPLVEEVNARAGSGLELVGVAEHGESGCALYVRWPDGRSGVLTRAQTPTDTLQQIAEFVKWSRPRAALVRSGRVRFDLARSTLYDGGQHGFQAEGITRLDDILEMKLDLILLRTYGAQWTLSRLDWTISHHPSRTVELFQHVGESRIA